MKQRIYQNQKKTKTFWCILREVTNVRPKSETIKEISVNSLMIQDSFEISNVMNEHFFTVGYSLTSNFHDVSDTANSL